MSRRTRVFGVEVDVLDARAALGRISALLDRPRRAAGRPALVVTPNLDHAVRLRRDGEFRGAYDAAELVLADGFPLVWASRLGGPPLPARVAGSDLILPICREAARGGRSIFVLGTTLEVLSIACRRLRAGYPDLRIAGAYAPSFGFPADRRESEEAVAMIDACRPDLLFVALGSPRQELWAARHLDRLDAAVVMCVGAGFDFLAGRPRRAPRVVRRLCLEWCWRLLRNPRRYGRRYAQDLVYLPLMMAEQALYRLRLWATSRPAAEGTATGRADRGA